MGMILRIASSRIVGQGDIVGRSGYFSLNLSANSVMRGRLDARRTLKSLVADLRSMNFQAVSTHSPTGFPAFRQYIFISSSMFLGTLRVDVCIFVFSCISIVYVQKYKEYI